MSKGCRKKVQESIMRFMRSQITNVTLSVTQCCLRLYVWFIAPLELLDHAAGQRLIHSWHFKLSGLSPFYDAGNSMAWNSQELHSLPSHEYIWGFCQGLTRSLK
jgi:hypothetical protein